MDTTAVFLVVVGIAVGTFAIIGAWMLWLAS